VQDPAAQSRGGGRCGGSWYNAWVITEVSIRDESIRLGQLLKLASLIEVGGDAKTVLAEGLVQVNDEVETRRGAQIRPGDVVSLGGESVRVVAE